MPECTLHQAEHRLEQRRLAGAVRADDADHLARVGDQAAAVEDVDARAGSPRRRPWPRRPACCVAALRVWCCCHRSPASSSACVGVLGGHLFGDLLQRLVGEQRVVTEVGVVVGAEVGVDHGRVGHHRVGGPLGHEPALGHHRHPVGDVAYDVHVVLDEEHGHALVAQAWMWPEQRLGQRRVHAGHRLVEHDHLRVAHQRPRHLEELALAAGEAAGVVVLLLEQLEARRAARRPWPRSPAPGRATAA